jgi:hypothetical protein
MAATSSWRGVVAGAWLCTFMIGVSGEIMHLSHPLCDRHQTACEQAPDRPVHVHTDVTTTATSS